MNLPNILTLLRMLMVPAVIVCFATNHPLWALFFFLLASATDVLDGYLARKFNLQDSQSAVLTDEELEAFRDLIRDAVLSTVQDNMVSQILSEELEPYFAGDRTAEGTAEIIEKRAGIYLAE